MVDNALRHGAGEVRLSASGGDSIELRVTDEGAGFPPQFIAKAFDRFSRADSSRARGGTGLGLAIVKHVVENHGGTIEVESELGRGTTFRVKLPAASRS